MFAIIINNIILERLVQQNPKYMGEKTLRGCYNSGSLLMIYLHYFIESSLKLCDIVALLFHNTDKGTASQAMQSQN